MDAQVKNLKKGEIMSAWDDVQKLGVLFDEIKSFKGENTCRGVCFARFTWFFLNKWFILYFWKLAYGLFIFWNNTIFFYFNYSKWPMYTTFFWEGRNETSRSADIVASVLLIWK